MDNLARFYLGNARGITSLQMASQVSLQEITIVEPKEPGFPGERSLGRKQVGATHKARFFPRTGLYPRELQWCHNHPEVTDTLIATLTATFL